MIQSTFFLIVAIFFSFMVRDIDDRKFLLIILITSLLFGLLTDLSIFPIILYIVITIFFVSNNSFKKYIICGAIIFLGAYKLGIHNLVTSRLILNSPSDQGLPYELVPSGISFMLITFCIMLFRYKRPDKLSTLSTVFFFPHLLAGPILHRQIVRKNISKSFFVNASLLFILGQIILIISNQVGDVYTLVRNSASQNSYITAWSFYLYLYGNFFGYSLIATAISLIFGIEIPINFNAPTLAKSPSDYWLRWHRSLSLTFRNYLYKKFRRDNWRAWTAIFLIMSISGLWHGIGFSFLIWGIVNAIFIILWPPYLSSMVSRLFMILLFPVTWIPFYSDSFQNTLQQYSILFSTNNPFCNISYIKLVSLLFIFIISCIPYKSFVKLCCIKIIDYSDAQPYGHHVKLTLSPFMNVLFTSTVGLIVGLSLFYNLGVTSVFIYQKF